MQRAAKSVYKLTKASSEHGKFFIDSAPLPIGKNIRDATRRTFRGMTQWAHSSISITFRLRMYIIADERQKIVGFMLKPGNWHNVTCAEGLLYRRGDIVIGDKGYCSESLAKRLSFQGFRPMARRRQNVSANSEEEKMLVKKRSIVQTVIGKVEKYSVSPYPAFALLEPLSPLFVTVFELLISLFYFAIHV
jgi:hypothetical protein